MIEAQSLYINALIKKVKAAKARGESLRLTPKVSVTKAYNDEIQTRLRQSAFADPNCNSWYKNEAGLITNNWADAVIPYQTRTSSIDWSEFDLAGSGADELRAEGKTSWSRVIEETQISNTALLVGLLATVGAMAAGTLYRTSLRAVSRKN